MHPVGEEAVAVFCEWSAHRYSYAPKINRHKRMMWSGRVPAYWSSGGVWSRLILLFRRYDIIIIIIIVIVIVIIIIIVVYADNAFIRQTEYRTLNSEDSRQDSSVQPITALLLRQYVLGECMNALQDAIPSMYVRRSRS
jgi:hypothetical protein